LKSIISAQKEFGSSSLLEVSENNYVDNLIDKRVIAINRLNSVLRGENYMGKIGLKIDVEGFESEVIESASETLRMAKFVLAEVRHNYESFKGVYKLHEFISIMHKNNFISLMILTGKPFIADLCFQSISDLNQFSKI
jgi:hypothetical protein